MGYILSAFFCVIALGTIHCVHMLIRNARVSTLRTQILDEMNVHIHMLIRQRQPWEWVYKRYNRVSYNTMLYTWWKPVDSFFPPVSEWREDD